MAGRISIDNLSNSLKNIIEQNGLTEAQVIELIKNISGDISQLNTSNKSSLVAAINELFQSANNGKQLIANAIGEPLSSNDTFSAMSSDINGLLATFKTNMMNNGVTVNSSDRFKSLIDKIATLADSEGKGVQIANGITKTALASKSFSHAVESKTSSYSYIEIRDLTFTPQVILAFVKYGVNSNSVFTIYNTFSMFPERVYLFSGHPGGTAGGSVQATIHANSCNIDSTGFTIPINTYNTTSEDCYWVAIGVGEEDTTLRDSLADILENKGVDVTEEDDMASLITKVEKGLVDIPGFIKQGCWMIAPIASNPNKAYNMSTMVAIGNNIHVMGGHAGGYSMYTTATNNHYAYNVKTNTWIERAKLPAERQRTVSIAVDDGIYNTGGVNSNYYGQKTTYYYDSISNSWTTKAAMPDFKQKHAFTSFDNKLFITGGADSAGEYGDKTFIYDILTDTWTQKEDYPENSDTHHALTIDSDRILVFTGGRYGDYYIPSTDTWTSVSYSNGTGNERSRMVFSSKTSKAYFANSANMVSMDFSNINQPTVEVISICKLNNEFGDVVEVNGNIYHMYGFENNNTMIIGIL